MKKHRNSLLDPGALLLLGIVGVLVYGAAGGAGKTVTTHTGQQFAASTYVPFAGVGLLVLLLCLGIFGGGKSRGWLAVALIVGLLWFAKGLR